MMHSVDCTRRESGRKPPVDPFAMLPHCIASDPRLSPVDVRVLLALAYYARAKPGCYPSDPSISARVGRSVPTVQRSLRRLQALGYIDRRPVTSNPTGRLIVLCWRRGPAEMITDDRPPRSSVIDPPRSPVIEELKKKEEEKRPSAAGCESPPPPSGTETAEASLPSPEEHAAFVRGLAGLPRGSWQVRLALANNQVTEAELAALASHVPYITHGHDIPQTPHVAPSPATPPEAGSPDPAVACAPTLVPSTSMPSTSPQAAPATDAATRPTATAPDRPASVDADAAGPGEGRRPPAHLIIPATQTCGRGHPGSMPIAAAWLSTRRHASQHVVPAARIWSSPFVPVMTCTKPPPST